MNTGFTSSERLVSSLSSKVFLSHWTHPNPLNRKGKELCDCLIVCGDHIIIISVKDIKYKETEDLDVGWQRWQRGAIDDSVKQLLGARRELDSVNEIKRSDDYIVSLPPRDVRKYHYLAVAFGSKGQVPLKLGIFENDFVHVAEEQSLNIMLNTLDTIGDFIGYMDALENFVRNGTKFDLLDGALEDLIVLYLRYGPSLLPDKKKPTRVLIQGLWQEFSSSQEYEERQTEIKDSYSWDRLIEYLAQYISSNKMLDMLTHAPSRNDKPLVTMVMETRSSRCSLGSSMIEFFLAENNHAGASLMKSDNGVAYVFLLGKSSERDARLANLLSRCIIVRCRMPGIHAVIGIASDPFTSSTSSNSFDIHYVSECNDSLKSFCSEIESRMDFFKGVNWEELE